MISLLKKPGLCGLVFFILLSTDIWVQTSEAAVSCRGVDRNENVSRNELASGGGGGRDREFAIPGTKNAIATLNGSVDLNITPDASAFAHGIVTETTNWVWRVDAANADNLTGYVTATYQFNGLIPGDNKICSSPSSCIDVTSISAINTRYQRRGNNNDPSRTIRRVQEAIRFTMDLSGATESGTYTGQLEITLSNGPDPSGMTNANLVCNIIL